MYFVNYLNTERLYIVLFTANLNNSEDKREIIIFSVGRWLIAWRKFMSIG